jgi:uncharacterized protein YeaO (DUF488 family)
MQIILGRVGQERKIQADVIFQITRSKKGIKKGVIWLPDLAPSPELFAKYLKWRAQGKWPAMWPEYERIFIKELNEKRELIRKTVVEWERKYNTVGLICYCPQEKYCHRKLIKEFITNSI